MMGICRKQRVFACIHPNGVSAWIILFIQDDEGDRWVQGDASDLMDGFGWDNKEFQQVMIRPQSPYPRRRPNCVLKNNIIPLSPHGCDIESTFTAHLL
jgi:hypothetical protein